MAQMLEENREINRLSVTVWLRNNQGGRSWTRKARRKGGCCQT